jgi:precorrin-6Y C5,15-methyltransferase (decarboxylating)
MLAHPSLRAAAIEQRADRAARIRRNAAAFGVPELDVVEGRAPEALAPLPAPDAIFIGGGAGDDVMLDTAITALKPGGRMVVNAVTLETEAALIGRQASLGGALTRITLSRADSVGDKTTWRPALPVTQWVWVKP